MSISFRLQSQHSSWRRAARPIEIDTDTSTNLNSFDSLSNTLEKAHCLTHVSTRSIGSPASPCQVPGLQKRLHTRSASTPEAGFGRLLTRRRLNILGRHNIEGSSLIPDTPEDGFGRLLTRRRLRPPPHHFPPCCMLMWFRPVPSPVRYSTSRLHTRRRLTFLGAIT